MLIIFIIFFFQAEDGIRDLTVTGVQTCALPISRESFATRSPLRPSDLASSKPAPIPAGLRSLQVCFGALPESEDRKSTRLNSNHSQISYAVFCLKKKKIIQSIIRLYVLYKRVIK